MPKVSKWGKRKKKVRHLFIEEGKFLHPPPRQFLEVLFFFIHAFDAQKEKFGQGFFCVNKFDHSFILSVPFVRC